MSKFQTPKEALRVIKDIQDEPNATGMDRLPSPYPYDNPFTVDLNKLVQTLGVGAREHSDLGVVAAGGYSSVETFLADRGRFPDDFPGRDLKLVRGEAIGLNFKASNSPARGLEILVSTPTK